MPRIRPPWFSRTAAIDVETWILAPDAFLRTTGPRSRRANMRAMKQQTPSRLHLGACRASARHGSEKELQCHLHQARVVLFSRIHFAEVRVGGVGVGGR